MFNSLAWLYWDPPKNVFTVPFLDRPIAWYGLLFVLGFILGYFIIIKIFDRFLRQTNIIAPIDILNWQPLAKKFLPEKNSLEQEDKVKILHELNAKLQNENITRDTIVKEFPESIAPTSQTAYRLADYLCWFVVLGSLIGARLGVVFFYDWPYFREHPIDIIKVWEGGLASHGGVIGILLGIYLYTLFIRDKAPYLSFLNIIDFVAVPTALASCFIRLGNFVNQEIFGIPSTVPWAIIFGHPIDGSPAVPRHPVQLYEAFCYLAIFVFLYALWKRKGDVLTPGMLSGLLLILVFTSRFILEFWKATQSSFIETNSFQVGQLLSLPFVALGFFLIWYGKKGKNHNPLVCK